MKREKLEKIREREILEKLAVEKLEKFEKLEKIKERERIREIEGIERKIKK